MSQTINRRNFLGLLSAGSMMYFSGFNFSVYTAETRKSGLISPGCRGTKVKVARLYLGTSRGLWPKPNLDFENEINFYLSQFDKYKAGFMICVGWETGGSTALSMVLEAVQLRGTRIPAHDL